MAKEDTAELELILRGLLVSNPKVTKAHSLERDFENNECRPFPYRSLGFSSFVEYLRSIPTVVQLVPHNSSNPEVIPFSSKASSHIDKLVSKQKVTAPRRSSSSHSRRGGYNGRAPRFGGSLPPRRRPPSQCPPPLSRPAPSKGVTVREIENCFREKYSTEDLNRNGIYSGDDLLFHAKDMVKQNDEKVYPKISSLPGFNSYSNHDSGFYTNHDTKLNSYSNYDPKSNSYANHESKSNSYSNHDPKSNSYSNHDPDSYKMNYRPAGSEEDYDDEYDDSYDYEFWENVADEEVANQTTEGCTESIVFTPTRNEEVKDIQKECYRPVRDDEDNFGKGMIQNFRKILDKHPDGIWVTELPDKYFEEFGLTLDIHSLGYSSAIEMTSHLPNVFKYQRVGSHDFKLYDSRVCESFQEEPVNNTFAECYDESVPKSILENIKKLVEQRPSGFRSTALHSLYMEQFHKKLDVETLGYKRLEDFLEVLKNVITVRKVTDYYLLLPKHKVVQLDTPESSEVLKIPKESIGFLGPDNVLMPSESLPSQQLPQVKYEAQSPQDPLLELEIRVGEVISPYLFYVMLDSKYNELQSMMEDLDKFYRQEESIYHIPLSCLTQNLICTCTYDGSWHRVKITGFRKNDFVEIEYIDYGTPGKVKRSDLRFLQCDFAKLPAQSICAKLIGIQPRNGESKWPKDACQEFLRLVSDKRLLAHVYNVDTKKDANKERLQMEVILYDTENPVEIILNEHLVEKGFADFVTKEILPEDTAQLEKQTSIQTIDITQSLPEDPVPVETVQWGRQTSTSPVDSSPSPSIPDQDNLPKRTSRPPPGFEMHVVESVQQMVNQPVVSQSPIYNTQANLISGYPYFYSQGHTNLSQSFNLFLALDNKTSYGLSNTPFLQQGFMPHHQVMNTPQVTTHNNSHLFPQAYIPPANVFYNPPPLNTFPPPPLNNCPPPPQATFLPSYPPGMGFPPPNAIFGSTQAHNNAASLNYPCAPVTLPPSDQYVNKTSPMMRKIPENNSEIRLPHSLLQNKPNNQHEQARSSSQPELVSQDHSPASSSPRNSPLLPTATSFKCEAYKEKSVCRPSPPLTPSSAEVASIYNRTRHKRSTDKCDVLNHLEDYSNEPEKEPKESLHLERLCESISSIESRISESSKLTKVSSASGDSNSTVESIEEIKQSKTVSLSEKDLMPQSVRCDSEINEKIPDSWEDIDPDDIQSDVPIKANSFAEDFKKTLSFLEDNESYLQKNPNVFTTVGPIITTENTNTIGNHLLASEQNEAPVNWKDIFNPDNITNELRWCDKNETNKETTRLLPVYVKKTLVQKLEIDNKFFHLICVNNEPAVVSYEFYPQFTPLNWHIILKIIDVKYKPFTVIKKADHPDLFVELEKVQFCGGVCKKKVLKFGRATISYLSEVSEVFAVLNVQDKMLLDTIKKISDDFNSCWKL